MIVDDSALERAHAQNIFGESYLLLEAASGEEALSLLQNQFKQISLILLDLVLPKMGGMEVLWQLKINKDYADIPVVIITSDNKPETEEIGLELGAVDFLRKPFNHKIAKCRVESQIKLYQAQMALEKSNQELRALADQLQTLTNNVPGGVYRFQCDPQQTILFLSDGYKALCDESLDLYQRSRWQIMHLEDRQKTEKSIQTQIQQNGKFAVRYRIVLLDGTVKWLFDKGQFVQGQTRESSWIDGVVIDISEQMRLEEQLHRLSYYDALTGLYNRRYFAEKLKQIQAESQPQLGLIFCDMDGLKLINDEIGHGAGDQALVKTADILRKAVPAENIICRIGGDEFAILVLEGGETNLQAIQEKIKEVIEAHNQQNGVLPIYVSLGQASAAVAGKRELGSYLTTQSDLDMYASKRRDKEKNYKIIRKVIRDLKTPNQREG